MKLIIDIDEKDYKVIKRECSNKDVVPIGWVQILNGKPLKTELIELQREIDDLIPRYYCADGLIHASWKIDERMKELNNE